MNVIKYPAKEEWKKLTAEGKEAIGEGLEELYDMFDIFL